MIKPVVRARSVVLRLTIFVEVHLLECTMFVRIDREGITPQGTPYLRGHFLILMRCEGEPDLPPRALVRYVKMTQVGHLMTTTNRIEKQPVVLSGAYGSNGSPTTVPQCIYLRGVMVPPLLKLEFGYDPVVQTTEPSPLQQWAQKLLPRPRTKPLMSMS